MNRINLNRLLSIVFWLTIIIVFEIFTNFGIANDLSILTIELPAEYTIEAVLDTSSKVLYGTETVRFYNPTDKPLEVITFHLYPNAFRDTSTVMACGSRRVKESIINNPGYINCDSITIDGRPPDSIMLDETLLYVYPRKKIYPSSIVEIKMNFEIKIPRTMMRYGYDDNGNYLFSHWHPILAGYQKNKPVVFQYSAYTEFFSNFSNYNVSLKIPENFKLGSTAGMAEPDSIREDGSYYSLTAKRVIDFAFVCGPSWEIYSYNHGDISISLMYLSENEEALTGIENTINNSLDYFGDRLFKYPYESLIFIDFSPGAGGMELPGMVIMSFMGGLRVRSGLAMTVIHETAHQWFYASIATNEAFEPWLDEGFASYLTDRAMKEFSSGSAMIDKWGIKISFSDLSSIAARFTKALNPLATSSDNFHDGSYFINVYSRATAVIKTLEGVIGSDNFDSALQDFAGKYKFKHPDTYDLLESFESSTGQDLHWFFDSYIFGTARVDYEVVSIESTKQKTDSDIDIYKTEIEAQRNLDGVLPQKLVVAFTDGKTVSQDWDGVERYKIFEFESETPAEWAAIDTGYYYLIDENLINNSRKAQPESRAIHAAGSKFVFFFQLIFAVMGLL